MNSIPTAVRDRSATDIDAVLVKLGVEDDDAAVDELDALLTAAKEDADRYLNNPFLEDVTDEDSDEVDIPALVELGLVEWVRVAFGLAVSARARMASLLAGEPVSDERTIGTNASTGGLSETRLLMPGAGAGDGIGAGLGGNDPFDAVRLAYWSAWRLSPL